MTIGIIDYGMGNLFSVQNALASSGATSELVSRPEQLKHADAVVLPGVGAFGEAMTNLKAVGLDEGLRAFVASGKPLLGICLGFQLLFTESQEFGITRGLGVVEGSIERLPDSDGKNRIKVPQIGWFGIAPPSGDRWSSPVLTGVRAKEYMYFVHSYYARPSSQASILTVTDYGDFRFCSGIREKNVVAFQFHPEKSGVEGLKIYENFVKGMY